MPEKDIRRENGTEKSDEIKKALGIKGKLGEKGGTGDGEPGLFNDESSYDIGEKSECEELEVFDIESIGYQDDKKCGDESKCQKIGPEG